MVVGDEPDLHSLVEWIPTDTEFTVYLIMVGIHQRGVRLDSFRLPLLTVEPSDLISVTTRALLYVRAEDILELLHFRILG